MSLVAGLDYCGKASMREHLEAVWGAEGGRGEGPDHATPAVALQGLNSPSDGSNGGSHPRDISNTAPALCDFTQAEAALQVCAEGLGPGRNARCQYYFEKRTAARATARAKKKKASAIHVQSMASLSQQKMPGGYIGSRIKSERPPRRKIIGCANGAAAYICDSEGRLIIYRSFAGPATVRANSAAMAAVEYLQHSGVKPTYSSSTRGNFLQYYFTLHRDNQVRPRMSLYYLKHIDVVRELGNLLKPVVALINGIFKSRFPDLYAHYAATLDYVLEKDAGLEALFYPFASFALNAGIVVTLPHLDSTNYGPGLCCIMPYGTFDLAQDCRIGIAKLGYEIEVGPGVPVFIPSAMFTHYNTILISKGMRGSLVFWTGGSIFQWVELGGKMVSELSGPEHEVYIKGLAARILAGLARFPMHM
ncbi:hypothetical protein SCP_1701150 [Sparassis crispa]|uniref:Uncharacterized protein n=1 Tax=Sparassis crispa TaxID=139825 RepID=A0A401H602_9APHY|nr:hypothetical protein SCP_1701150 [Sparassis crispa]GBE89790.1 hypothetical protein SCP_1701150 [Sparassis crispa]